MEPTTLTPVPSYRPLRAWIPILLLPSMLAARYFSVWFPEVPMVWMVGAFVPALLGILILLWWLILSKATWTERLVGLAGTIAAIVLATSLMDSSMKGPPVIVLTVPTTFAAFGLVLVLLRNVLSFRRTLIAVVCAFLTAGISALLKNEGVRGDFSFGFSWRWTPTAEEVFLANRAVKTEKATGESEATALKADSFTNPAWPGFRGPQRNSVQSGMRLDTDWEKSPPRQLWRIKVGPAWSSFAVADKFLVTQEQRGQQEAVVCYAADTGQEVWAYENPSRFFDGLGGLGPRSTPYIANGNVYALGAEGWLVKLNATDGTELWKTDVREFTNGKTPMWGFSCSPIVVGDFVVVHAASEASQGVIAAYETSSGKIGWSVPANKDSYSSPHLTNYFGTQQLAFLGSDGLTLLDPMTGETLLSHELKTTGYRALQPVVVDDRHLLFTSEYNGSRFIELSHTEKGLAAKEIWTSRSIKPDFNDLVIQDGFGYGFDGAIFVCIDLKDGSRRWRKGRYGKGQVMLLADSKQLLVISEHGELVVLKASPDEHQELARLQALDGKTWNHPVIVGDRLYLRNANEAVCYQLAELPFETKGKE